MKKKNKNLKKKKEIIKTKRKNKKILINGRINPKFRYTKIQINIFR